MAVKEPTKRQTSQQAQLGVNFPREMIKKTPKGNAKLDYVPVHEVIIRLNEVLGYAGWSWTDVKIWRDNVNPDWILAQGKLTATIDGLTATKEGSGGVKIKKLNSDPKEPVDLGDEYKGAESDALKKAAQRFGVGIHLARSDEAIRYEAPQPVRDAIDEGWESVARQKQFVDNLTADIKALSKENREVMKSKSDELEITWPPTFEEYEALVAFMLSLQSQPKTIGSLIGTHFPGAQEEELKPRASKDKIDKVASYLATMEANGEKTGTLAWKKYSQARKYPDLEEFTEEQAIEAIEFIESLA